MFDVSLNNGLQMPVLGLGVYLTKDFSEMQTAVDSALEAGYRSFDTAQMYQNEQLLGAALQNAGIPREELFLTSKLDLGNMEPQKALDSFQESLEKLQTDYLDLFLIHWPGQKKMRLQEVWRVMEDLYKKNRVRAIGVCNCTPRHLEWILENAEIPPAVNQIERHPLLNHQELFSWCAQKEIRLEAWAPLIRGNFDLPALAPMAKKYGKTPAQVILRWDIQSGYIVIPKSVHRTRIFENADIFDFALEKQDMDTIDGMDTGHTTGWDLDTFDF